MSSKFPLIVSYHTSDRVYSKCAVRLERSLDKYELDYVIEMRRPVGNWNENAAYKSIFILNQLNRYGRDIVWLDADSEVLEYPEEFGKIDADMASLRWPGELFECVLYLKNNNRVKQTVMQWIQKNEEYCGWPTAAQKNLEILLAEETIPIKSFGILPPSYGYVEGEMPAWFKDKPVIQQHMASRNGGHQLYGTY